MRTISRWELIKMISERVDHKCPQWVIYYVVQVMGKCMEDIIRDGNRLVIKDTFSLQPVYKKERVVSNFGKPIVVPGHYVPQFRAYHKLKDACAEYEKNLQNEVEGKEDVDE